MRSVRTFRARTMPEALALVKRELGPGAIILGTRAAAAGGIGRLVGRELVEITAAPPETATPAPRLANPPARPGRRQQLAQEKPGRQSVAGADAGPADRPRPVRSNNTTPGTPAPPALPEDVYPYFVRLVENEVAEELAARVVRTAISHMPDGGNANVPGIEEVLRDCIAAMIPTAGPILLPAGTTRRVALLGPPGGGKTTTLAKLAAHLKLRQQKQVALLSLDLHRPAGDQQLHRYADIIRVPMEFAQTVPAVREATRRLGNVDCLLIDTSGLGPREAGRFARLAALLRAARPDELHLVLPACTTPAAQARMAEAFAPLGASRTVLTHLDEAVGFGVVLNAMDRLPGQLSYLCAGQNIPWDIEEACSRRLAELIYPAIR